MNRDEKREYFVKDMPSNLSLLCANMYASDGAAVLFKDEGFVLKLSDDELHIFKNFVAEFDVFKKLKVVNRTYEIDNTFVANECAHSSTATRYFNTKVNISNSSERVLTMMLTGLTFSDLYSCVKNKSIDGIPPDLTMNALNNFEHKYGRTPDIVRLAIPVNFKSRFGLMSTVDVTLAGQRVEIDVMFSDYNMTAKGKTKKVPSHGGALCGAVAVDVFSGFVKGRLLKSTANSKEYVAEFINSYKLDKVTVLLIAADSGVNSESKFRVYTSDVEQLLLACEIKSERAEPRNHSRGTPVVERTIRQIKELIHLAIVYILTNPNFDVFGFSQLNILKLWGELFNWAIAIINLKSCPNQPEITRYEAFKCCRPNFQNIRILPIFSAVLVYRESNSFIENSASRVNSSELGNNKIVYSSNQAENKIALYIGPSMNSPGCIRAATMTNNTLQIYVTSRFSAPTDGGGLNVHKSVENGVKELIELENNDKLCDVNTLTAEYDGVVGEPVVDNKMVSTVVTDASIVVEKSVVIDDAISSEKNPEVPVDNAVVPTVDVVAPAAKAKRGKARKPSALAVVPAGNNPYSKGYGVAGTSREERLRSRMERVNDLKPIAEYCAEVETACFADWSTFADDDHGMYWSFSDCSFVEVSDFDIAVYDSVVYSSVQEEGYRAVKDDVPRTYAEALRHPLWGEPARKELNTLISTNAIVEIDRDVAIDCINNNHADLVVLFPVYEVKVKEGVTVYKVRLVGDGRTHYNTGNTYAATPSREELLVLLHICAALGWHYAHVDEIRAFLSASYKGVNRVFTKLRSSSEYYEVKGALYGLKSSPKDYQDEVAERLLSLGYKRLHMCSCMYILVDGDKIIIIYDFVDDFIFTGYPCEFVTLKIMEMRCIASTTEPVWDAERVLGLQLSRDILRKIICVRMTDKIAEIYAKFDVVFTRKIEIPMPTSGYIIKDEQFEKLNVNKRELLDKKGIKLYMGIVGSLIWVAGIRLDILYTVMYLSWSTKNPRVHHLDMAKYCIAYLYQSRDLPLVLGGSSELQITAYTDASVGTAAKGRSVIGHLVKLNASAGAIYAKSTATQGVHLSSFEAELDGLSTALKSVSRVRNILVELRRLFAGMSNVFSDNEAMVDFVHGNGVAKGVRHMELRMWYVREKYKHGNVVLDYMEGINIPADKLTKLGNKASHAKFRSDVLGLSLLAEYFVDKYTESDENDVTGD